MSENPERKCPLSPEVAQKCLKGMKLISDIKKSLFKRYFRARFVSIIKNNPEIVAAYDKKRTNAQRAKLFKQRIGRETQRKFDIKPIISACDQGYYESLNTDPPELGYATGVCLGFEAMTSDFFEDEIDQYILTDPAPELHRKLTNAKSQYEILDLIQEHLTKETKKYVGDWTEQNKENPLILATNTAGAKLHKNQDLLNSKVGISGGIDVLFRNLFTSLKHRVTTSEQPLTQKLVNQNRKQLTLNVLVKMNFPSGLIDLMNAAHKEIKPIPELTIGVLG